MISHKFKFIFIHIPKTGGTSIEKFFDTKLNYDLKHLTNVEYDEECVNCNGYIKFSVIRNPWERMVSYWNYRQSVAWATDDGEIPIFTDWMKFVHQKKSRPLLTMFDFLRDKTDTIKNIHLIRFENLQEDFDIVCDKIKIPKQELPHSNNRNHKHYTEYYDDETREIVAEKYAKDIEYFGYKFGN